MSKFIEFNAMEHKKGEDFFSMDKALFNSMLFENYGPVFLPAFMPHIQRLTQAATTITSLDLVRKLLQCSSNLLSS